MKKMLTCLLFSMGCFLAQAQTPNTDASLYQNDHYKQRVTLFNSQPVLQGRIIFLGNSITEFGEWRRLLNDSTVINRGIAGDNTYGVLARLNDVVKRRPAKLFIEIGINDFALDSKFQATVKNVFAIATKVHVGSPGTRVYVLSILPTNDNTKTDYPFAFHKGKQVDQINRKLLMAAGQQHYTFIDLNSRLKDLNGKLDKKYAMPDGIHLNEQGYQLWMRLLKSDHFL
jgi:lysophospholipase L1-like esterase